MSFLPCCYQSVVNLCIISFHKLDITNFDSNYESLNSSILEESAGRTWTWQGKWIVASVSFTQAQSRIDPWDLKVDRAPVDEDRGRNYSLLHRKARFHASCESCVFAFSFPYSREALKNAEPRTSTSASKSSRHPLLSVLLVHFFDAAEQVLQHYNIPKVLRWQLGERLCFKTAVLFTMPRSLPWQWMLPGEKVSKKYSEILWKTTTYMYYQLLLSMYTPRFQTACPKSWSVRGKQHDWEGAPEEVSQPKCAVCFFLKTIQNIQKHITK